MTKKSINDLCVSIVGVGTALPPHILPQDLVQKNAQRILGPRYPDFERLSKTFLSSGIEKRHSVRPFEWFEEPKSWPDRTKAYLEGATDLFIEASKKALAKSGLEGRDIDTIVTVSSTGIATPTLEARAFDELGLRQDVKRVPVFGLGCAGGVSGLSIATRLARAEPGSNVLIVAVETCTLSFRSDRMQKADIIATALFGDGAAAVCIHAGTHENALTEIGNGYEHTWPNTLPIMGWDVDVDGFGVIFDRSIPSFVTSYFRDAAEAAMARFETKQADLTRFICHPGGAKVVTAIEEAMNLEAETLTHEREVLKDCGNMSAPTVLFVLERVIEDRPNGNMVMTALGPGFTGSFLEMSFNGNTAQ